MRCRYWALANSTKAAFAQLGTMSIVGQADGLMKSAGRSVPRPMSRIDADTNVAGDQAFRFVGGGAFTGNGTGGELRSTTDAAGRSVVEGDVNGDGVADFTLFVMDATPATPDPLVVSDFIL